jgi:hypothetical protein
MNARRTHVLLVAALALAATTCGKKESATTSPVVPPPQIQSVFPAPRSAGVYYETEIWAQFATPLVPATVNEHTVFLKVDDARIPIDVAYEPDTRRIRITPRVRLGLRQTHTVRLMPDITDQDGAPLGTTFLWQFTTNGVRRIESPLPPTGTEEESPFVRLVWSGTEAEAGPVQYRVYSGEDSAAVAAHVSTYHDVPRTPRYLPRERWPLGSTIYWTVTATNQISGDHLDGPVWRVGIMPAGFPIDSLVLGAEQWGNYSRAARRASCTASSITSGPDYLCAVRYRFGNVPSDVRLAGAAITLPGSTVFPTTRPTLWGTITPWVGTCGLPDPSTPFVDEDLGALGDAITLYTSRTYFRFDADVVASHVEAAARYGDAYGYAIRSDANLNYSTIVGETVFPLRIYYYRMPASTP